MSPSGSRAKKVTLTNTQNLLTKYSGADLANIPSFVSPLYNPPPRSCCRLSKLVKEDEFHDRAFCSGRLQQVSYSSVGPDFFSPQPRRVKGKEKAVSDSERECRLLQCQEWSSCISRHALWCPHQSRSMMLDELSRTQSRSVRHSKSRAPLSRRRFSRSSLTSGSSGQRRHASNASDGAVAVKHEVPPPHFDRISPQDLPSTREASSTLRPERRSTRVLLIQQFERVAQTPRAHLDMDEAWNTFQGAQGFLLPLQARMEFVDKYLSAAELHYRLRADDMQLHEWGRRTISMLDTVTARISPTSRFSQWRLCLLARSLALLGNFEAAIGTLHDADQIPLSYQHKAGIPYAYEMIISSLARYRGNAHAVELIAEEWSYIASYLSYHLSTSHSASQKAAGRSLRAVAYRIAAEISDPSPFLERGDWSKERRETIGCFFIDALCYSHLPTQAREVLIKMQKLGLHVPSRFQLTVVRFLAKQSSLVRPATELLASIPDDNSLQYLRTGLYAYSRWGKAELAETYFNRVAALGPPGADDVASLIHAHAVADNVDQANAIFNQYFPLDGIGKRMHGPTHAHYASVIYAHSRQGDQASITYWLKDLANADLVPNNQIFTLVLNSYAHAGDIEAVMGILEQMREAGIQPTVVTYTIIITLLAHRKDSIAAEDTFKRAIKEGIVPDSRMIVAMMNAHVEAGSWKGVIRAYDYLTASRVTTMSIDVYNTLMKAYVLVGAPFSVVYKLFKRLERSQTKPDAYTYSLVVQSACDSGYMDVASDIYYEMEQLPKEQLDRGLRVNVYILTILMAGFLQHGDKIRAKAVYDEMREKGIAPTPITFGTIIKAYGNEKSRESLRIAEEFIKSLVAVPRGERTWQKPKYDSKSALHHLYGPVMSAYAKLREPEEVERVFQDMLNEGAPPSLGTLSALLDVHRRTFDVDAVMEIWPRIYEMGLALTNRDWLADADDRSETRGIRGNVLCVPLSIYIDALSAAGRHSEIAIVWKDFRARGFTFDSHNWNHLVVALVRAGQPERAFEVVEKVLIPFQELSERSKLARERSPSSPLLSDSLVKTGDIDTIEEAPGEPPQHRISKRVLAAKIATSRTRRMPGWDADEQEHDFAHNLHVLHQISPSWATWRPHSATLAVLLTSLNRLSAGTLVQAIMPHGGSDQSSDRDQRAEAREILDRIYNNYPKTIIAVFNYGTYERQRLGSDYEKEYSWG
ncbi:putative pentatricopeptide repeat domain contaitning protein [Lyophyllum shimeji]|uniref:Pentatricopeptide repeat domain contaitning protein n=1 Tax=Lyophyllum shimeji TaxID=47721 RepID=A0A9P3UK35_LYOSH|nr:putative pentatricopeptide repeat domain contaitning protein [Lyophyllum shimeji]